MYNKNVEFTIFWWRYCLRGFISKLAKGIFEYETPSIETSVSSIELTLEADTIYSGNFELYSTDSHEVKGIVYSTNDKLEIITPQFVGKHNVIKYKVLTEYSQIGDILEGYINVICNGIEFEIPFKIYIDVPAIITTNGLVNNLDAYINLVQLNYEEALALFVSKEFSKALLAGNNKYLSIYEGLISGNNKHIALEEFLVGINKKDEVRLTLSEESKSFYHLEESYSDSIFISKNNWGYVYLEVSVLGEFIESEKKIITTEEFAGNHYELKYLIRYEKLHAGYNYACIRIKSNSQIFDYYITVKHSEVLEVSGLKVKKNIHSFIKKYLEYRMNYLTKQEWIENSHKLLNSICVIENDSVIYAQLQAYMLVAEEKYKEAGQCLDKIALKLVENREEDIDLYCIYLYIKTLLKQDYDFTSQIVTKINEYFNQGHDRFILSWILLDIDESLLNNHKKRLNKIKDQYQNSCRSPLMYVEAIKIFNENPENLRQFNEFELHTIFFGTKYNYISIKLAKQIAEIAVLEKKYNPLLYKILKYLYKQYNDKQILEAICSILIRGNKYDQEYFEWFSLGVKSELKITKLYEYYIYSINTEFTEVLPQNLLMYFIYNANTLQDMQSYLYYNIIINKDKIEKMYYSYLKHIEKYAISEIKKGNINKYLSIIYKDILSKTDIDAEILNKLPELIHTYRLECNNRNISRVIVCHDESSRQIEVNVNNRIANIILYTPNFNIIFEDINGNRYFKTVEYKLYKLIDEDKYINMCLLQNPNHELLMMNHINAVLHNSKNHSKTLNILWEITNKDIYRIEYIKILMEEVFTYYYRNYNEEIIDEYLLLFNKDNMINSTRIKILELLIMRGMYSEAYSMFAKYGCLNVDPSKIIKFVIRILEDKGTEEDQVITKLCIYAFKHGKYNEMLLHYLGNYYYATTKEMIELWKALKNFDCDNRVLEERILVQILFTKAYSHMCQTIYNSYYQKGAKDVIRNAYYNYQSFDYYLKDNVTSEDFFTCIEKELVNNFYINDICKIAYLKFHVESKGLTESQILLCKKVMYDLTDRNIVLEFFKHYKKWFTIPSKLKAKLILEYKANPNSKVILYYILETGQMNKKAYNIQELNAVYPGIFTKEFHLFYGESVLYYITEETGKDKLLTESMNLSLSDDDLYTGESRYGSLNNMMLSMDMNEESTLKDLALQYSINRFLIDNIFDIV